MANNEASLLIRIKQAGGEILDKISGSLSALGDMAKYVGVALAGIGAAAVNSFRDSEQATNALNQAMVQQGIYSADLAKKYGEMATKLESLTTFADEQITSAQATLQAYVGQKEITEQLTKATLDFAQAKQIDLKSAAEAIGKSIGGETNALARYGIEVDASADKTTRMAQAIQGLNSKFGGQAEAAAKGLGTLDQLKNALDNVLEVVGERMAPFIAFFTVQLKNFSKELQSSSDFVKGLDASIIFISKSFSVLKNIVIGTAEAIGTGLASALEAASLIRQGEFAKAKEMASLGMDEIARMAVERKNLLNQELAMIDEQKDLAEEQKRIEQETLIAQSEARKTEVAMAEAEKRKKIAEDSKKKEFEINQQKLQAENTYSQAKANIVSASANLIAALSGEGSKAAFLAQKAAAIAQTIVATNVAAAQALAVPPAPNVGLAAMAKSAGYINLAAIAATTIKGLATGGIVSATNGGTPFILGEGGKDEAVIPLDDPAAQERLGGGSGTTIIFNGPIMGDETQAMELARAIDKSLLKLRQTNQSVAFEEGIF